jgi:UDP-glucose 4-epimerase
MRVLVTGVAGFIGSHVADHCLAQGLTVVGVDDLSGGVRENIPAGVHFVEGDLRDPAVVAQLWSEAGPFEHVYHLAAYAAEGLSHFVRRFNYATNLMASMNLINAAVNHGTRTFVFASSIAVYGAGQTPLRECMEPRPEDPYGISKYAVELDLQAAHRQFGLDYIIFRPHNVYGDRQNIADRYRNVIGIFMNQAMQGQPMTIFGDGQQTRAFSHVDDVAPVIAQSPFVPAARNEVFNVGADSPFSVLQLGETVARAMGVEPRFNFLPARNEVVHAISDHTKARSVFQARAAVDLESGIQRMAAWARLRGPQPMSTFGDIEVRKNLPTAWLDLATR